LPTLSKASAADIELIEMYSKLSVPPLNPLANTVPVPSPPAHPAVVLSVTGTVVGVGVCVCVGVGV
jgi:hypothetical protein